MRLPLRHCSTSRNTHTSAHSLSSSKTATASSYNYPYRIWANFVPCSHIADR